MSYDTFDYSYELPIICWIVDYNLISRLVVLFDNDWPGSDVRTWIICGIVVFNIESIVFIRDKK